MTPLANLALAIMLLQYPYPYPRVRTTQPAAPGGANTDAVATFTGTFKSADKKYLTITVAEGNTMRMYITHSTKFIRDGKPAKAKDFQADENVSVDASRDARFNLIAVRVEAVKPKPPKSPPDAKLDHAQPEQDKPAQ